MYKTEISLFERIIACLSYLSFGTIGFIWLLVAFFTKNSLKDYLKYHIYQALFLSIFYYIVSQLLGLIVEILSFIPLINKIALSLMFSPFLFGLSIISFFVYLVIFYLAITSLLGKYSYIPWVSEIIRQNTRY